MNPCGVIVTYIDWKKVKKWFFNIPLFIYQLTLIIFGTAWGKIRWPKPKLVIRVLSATGCASFLMGAICSALVDNWYLFSFDFIIIVNLIATYRGIDWRRVWRAAQVSHVRLSLQKLPDIEAWEYINFGYPKAEIQRWTSELILNLDPKRFRYYDPTFSPSPEFIEAMIEYANKQVGKGYDDLQLISNSLHLIAWIIWPWCWGKELKIIKAFNRKGGREHCISGVTACLRNADFKARHFITESGLIHSKCYRWKEKYFFEGYSTATTSPCLVPLSENWILKQEEK